MNKTIKEIKVEFAQAEDNQTKSLDFLINEYKNDSRSGVKQIVNKYIKQKEDLRKEIERTNNMKVYEKKYRQYTYIGGIDEVGRGPLAGPVCAACVILPKDCDILHINDSKKLSEKKRESLYDEIIEKAICFGVGSSNASRIDEINILQATYEAMKNSIADMNPQPDLLLVDAETIPNLSIEQLSIIKGDSKSISIAAASIVAKVVRDRLMVAYDKIFPQYNFASNKGYGSKEHIEAIKKYGPCPIHRRSFIKNFI